MWPQNRNVGVCVWGDRAILTRNTVFKTVWTWAGSDVRNSNTRGRPSGDVAGCTDCGPHELRQQWATAIAAPATACRVLGWYVNTLTRFPTPMSVRTDYDCVTPTISDRATTGLFTCRDTSDVLTNHGPRIRTVTERNKSERILISDTYVPRAVPTVT